MTDYMFLVPIALGLGVTGLIAFLWALRSGQYEDIDGAAERVLFEDDDRPLSASRDRPSQPASRPHP